VLVVIEIFIDQILRNSRETLKMSKTLVHNDLLNRTDQLLTR
jgi:hypothetical protein